MVTTGTTGVPTICEPAIVTNGSDVVTIWQLEDIFVVLLTIGKKFSVSWMSHVLLGILGDATDIWPAPCGTCGVLPELVQGRSILRPWKLVTWLAQPAEHDTEAPSDSREMTELATAMAGKSLLSTGGLRALAGGVYVSTTGVADEAPRPSPDFVLQLSCLVTITEGELVAAEVS